MTLGDVKNYFTNKIKRFPRYIGGFIAGTNELGKIVFNNLKENGTTILRILANFGQTWLKGAVGTAAIIAAGSIMLGGPFALTASLLAVSSPMLSFPTRIIFSGIFAGVLSNFQWVPNDKQQPRFIDGLTMFWFPKTTIVVQVAKALMLKWGVLQPIAASSTQVKDPFASTEIFDEHVDRAAALARATAEKVYAAGEIGAIEGEVVAADMLTVGEFKARNEYSRAQAIVGSYYEYYMNNIEPAEWVDNAETPEVTAAKDRLKTRANDLYESYVRRPCIALGIM